MGKSRYKDQEKFFQKLGQKIKNLRLENELTQEDMFEKGFSVRFYQRIEAGKPVHMKTILKLADAFDIAIADLFSDL